MIPLFFGLSGPALTADERALFSQTPPAGYILFARNIVHPDQVRRLTDSLRALAGDPLLPVLIDQEGGRVARLRPPHWPEFPPQRLFGALWEKAPLTAIAAARANAAALGAMLRRLGITVDCLPLVDVATSGMHDVIGDRSFGSDPLCVAALGRAVLDGLRSAGVAGVVKHIPGHGRATLDSHLALPEVDADATALDADLLPFARLRDAPMAMTAHIVYHAWDSKRCATLSPVIIHEIIRGRLDFDGLLMSDDIDMKALGNQPGCATVAGRAVAVLEAGCDIALHCSGDFAAMAAIAASAPSIGTEARSRLERAMAWAPASDDNGATVADLCHRRDALIAAVA
jgi:beta-N-acetylhexosaminidase